MSKTAAEAFTSQDVRNRVELLTDDEHAPGTMSWSVWC